MTASRPEDGNGAAPGADGVAPPEGARLGISLSGGGIRSAAFSLGACQRLIEAGVLERAKYLSAVSGGGYIAAGLAISHATSEEKEPAPGKPPPWGRGSEEEASLRRNLTYLAPGGRGQLWLFANLLYGLVLNLVPLVLGAYVCGRLVGVLLGLLYPDLGSGEGVGLLAAPGALAIAAALLVASIFVVGQRRFLDKNRLRDKLTERPSERRVMILLIGAGVVLALGIALPAMILLLGKISTSGATDFGPGGVSFLPRRIAVGLAIVAISIGLGGVAVWLLRRRRLRRLRGVIAYAAGVGILFAPFLLAAQTGAAAGLSLPDDLLFLAVSGFVLLVFAVLVHNRRYSMHLFYRERLQDAFALRRERDEDTGEVRAEKIPYEETIRLSEVDARSRVRTSEGAPAFPKLVMCAAVAARGPEVPNKAWAAGFTFEGDFSGSESAGLKAPTTDLEHGDWLGGGDVTLPGMMAISGAAISPLMGRFTLPGFRFLMAMLNIRLGVWLRNPNCGPVEEDDDPGWLQEAWGYVRKGWSEPGALYVLKEAFGLAGTGGKYVYVSDGGHWENLGLTELLRNPRRCTYVIVVDASGDPGLGDIARAMSVARAELGVEFKLDPSPTIAGEDGLAETPVVRGSFKYRDGVEGAIYYARSVLWDDAPSDLRLLADREHPFPNHPTSNQFLSGELFDAYRALGWAVGDHLVPELSLPPARWDAAISVPEASAAT